MRKRNPLRKSKSPSSSAVIMTEVVFPNDTNPMGMVQGGRIIQLMDIASAICAQTHAGTIAVTAGIDRVSFRKPARVGAILTVKARLARAFKSSMVIFAQVHARELPDLRYTLISEAWLTFVALDPQGRPSRVIPIRAHTANEKILFRRAHQFKNKQRS